MNQPELLKKATLGNRLTPAEGLLLLESHDLAALGTAADAFGILYAFAAYVCPHTLLDCVMMRLDSLGLVGNLVTTQEVLVFTP